MPPADDAPKGPGKAWIFVSHSHHDIVAIRTVRNELEALGHFPLLFFLRSINDDDEVDSLIKREIRAREFFLLCDSPNARSSRWVQREIAFIKSLGRTCETVDLQSDFTEQLKVIRRLSRRTILYFSYFHADCDLVLPIYNQIAKSEYRVWRDRAEEPGGLDATIKLAIQECLAEGMFLLFITPTFKARSGGKFVRWEMEVAISEAARFPDQRVVPLLFDGVSEDDLPDEVKSMPRIDLRGVPLKKMGEALLRGLRAL